MEQPAYVGLRGDIVVEQSRVVKQVMDKIKKEHKDKKEVRA